MNYILEVAAEIPQLIMLMRDALDQYGRDPERASADGPLLDVWTDASPEARSALLLSMAWASREATPSPAGPWPAEQYAGSLHDHAAQFSGDSEAWHGPRFPAPPLPGPAGTLASSLGHDREDVHIALETALLLLAAIPTPAQEA